MTSSFFSRLAALSLLGLSTVVSAGHHGDKMHKAPADTVVSVAVGSPDHTTLVAAVKAAGLVETLSGEGPFTVFAPTNAAFAKLPSGTVEGLLTPEGKDTLTAVLTYHVVPGRLMASDVLAAIKAGEGEARVTTVQGGVLTVRLDGDAVVLTDAKGGQSKVIATDLKAGNGVVHVLDTVVMP